MSSSVACTPASRTITTEAFSLADHGPARGGAAVLKIFGGHLRRGLAGNQDETVKSTRSSNCLLLAVAIDQNVENGVKHDVVHSTAESGFEKFQSTCSPLRPCI